MFGFFSKKKPAPKASAKTGKSAPTKPAAKAAPAPAAAAAKPKPAAKEEPVSAGASLERAKTKLATKSAGGREALIEQALAVQQAKAKMLDKLPEETRMRLRAMALKAFVLPADKDKSKLN